MTQLENLLNKYYKGQTSLEEEKQLKALMQQEAPDSVEGEIFSFYEKETHIPDGLEEDVFAGFEKSIQSKKPIRMRLYSAISAAAMVLIILTVYLDFKKQKRIEMEDNFFVMERALFQVSESLQPAPEKDDMLILWVDDDVEIIIN